MVGVSSACLYPMFTEISLKTLANEGVKCVEVFFNSPSELTIDFAKGLKEICEEYDIKVSSIHPFTSFAEPFYFFNMYERRQKDAFDLYNNFFEVAAFLGAEIFNFHGQRKDYPISVKEYAETYCKLFELAKRQGIVFSQENVCRNVSGFSDFITDLRAEAGNDIAFTLDVKQANRAGVSPFEMANIMSDKLALVHINDFDLENDCLLPFAGKFDLTKFLQLLKSHKYHGDFIIEVYSKNYKYIQEIIQSKRRLENEVSLLQF